MMEARMTSGLLLKKIFDAIKDMITDVNLECDESGITLQAMDSSHVSLVSLKLKDSAFDQYRCDVNRSLGLNMSSVCKVFKLCGNNDSVIIRHIDDGDLVEFVFENNKEERMSSFELKLMQIDQEHLGVPETDFAVIISMPSKELTNICRNLSEFNDSVTIEVDKNGVKFQSKGDIGGGRTILKPRASDNEEEAVEIKVDEPLSLIFALRYLNYFTKASPLANSVKLSMTEGQPLEVKFDLWSNSQNCGFMKFFLAPKMDDDSAMA